MKSAEKVTALTKYLEHLKQRQTAEVPERHQKAPHALKLFLDTEVRRTESSLAKLKA